MPRKLFLFSACLFLSSAYAQTQQEIKNLTAFAKSFGYVRYFHPSDEAAELKWNQFSSYGAKAVLECKNDQELQTTLQQLFQPIAPTVQFDNNSKNYQYDNSLFIPANTDSYKPTYWQHEGLGLGVNYKGEDTPYKSVRVNRPVIQHTTTSRFGNILTSLKTEEHVEKKFKFSAWVKISPETEGSAQLWVREDNADKTDGFFRNMSDKPITSTEWEHFEISGKLSDKSGKLTYGCFLIGEGDLYLDDAELSFWDGKNWVPYPIDNQDFESDGIGLEKGAKEQWSGRGDGFEFLTTTDEAHSGKKSGMIKFIPPQILNELAQPIFDEAPKSNEVIRKELVDGLSIYFPIQLYCNEDFTYPDVDVSQYEALTATLNEQKFKTKDLEQRLGNVIITYNVFEHFYPYFDVVDVNWDQELNKALKRSFTDKNKFDHNITLEKLTATLKDGHVSVSGGKSFKYSLPLHYQWVENQLIITKTLSADLPVKKGDIITHIDGVSTDDFYKELSTRISAGTKGFRDYMAQYEGLYGPKNSKVVLRVNGKDHTVKRDFQVHRMSEFHSDDRPVYEVYNDNIYYLNLDVIAMDSINDLMPELKKAKAIICDLRGYPNGNHEFIQHLMKTDDTTTAWMQVPKIIYPESSTSSSFSHHNWLIPKKKPYLGDKNVIFIIDGRAISYAESYMGYIEGYDLATIIGEPTAGTNGNVNPFALPGGFNISWTGMKVLKHNGTQHHAIGVLPDVYVNRTIEGVRADRDEYLEKALEIARQ